MQSDLPDSVYAFPNQRKEPLTEAQHVRDAVARFDQVINVSDADHALAFVISRDSIVIYEAAFKAGRYLVVAHETSAEAAKARKILGTLKPTHVTDHVLEPDTQAVAR